MPFGVVGRTGPGIRQAVGFGDRSTVRGTFGANLGSAMVHGDLLDVRVLQRRDAALLLNYFGQTCCKNGMSISQITEGLTLTRLVNVFVCHVALHAAQFTRPTTAMFYSQTHYQLTRNITLVCDFESGGCAGNMI